DTDGPQHSCPFVFRDSYGAAKPITRDFESGKKETRKRGTGIPALKLARLPLSLGRRGDLYALSRKSLSSIETRSAPALTRCYLAALPSISEIPFPRFLLS